MERLPVSEFQILLALLAGAMHGAAIRDAVAERTQGAVHLGPGTLYTLIRRLLARGWIDEVTESGTDVRRFYRVTAGGRAEVAREVEQLEQDIAWARRYRLARRTRPT